MAICLLQAFFQIPVDTGKWMCRMESPATAKPREMRMNTKWNHATIQDDSITDREDRRAEDDRGCAPIDFTFTPQERDVVLLTQLDVIAMKSANRQYTPGLVVIHLDPSELTEQERDSYARFGGVL